MTMKQTKVFFIVCLFMLSIFANLSGTSLETIPETTVLPDSSPIVDTQGATATPAGVTTSQSIKTDIEFNAQVPNLESFSFYLRYDPSASTYSYHTISVNGMYYDDAVSGGITYYCDPAGSHEGAYIDTKIYCGGAGIFSYKFFTVFDCVTDYKTGTTKDSTLTVTSTMLDALGYLYLSFELFAVKNNVPYAMLYYLNVGTGGETLLDTSQATAYTSDLQKMMTIIDHFSFTRSTIVNNIRSSYQYASESVIVHSVVIPSVPHAKEINIYAPEAWEYSSINPSATVTNVGSDYTITSPTELEYTVIFNSNSSYFLAIEEKTDSYLSDIGFENAQYSNDWQDINSQMDSVSIVTNIVSEGYHSLKLESSSGDNFYLSSSGNVKLSEGYYYVSFDIYVEAGTSNVYFKPYENGVWSSNCAYENGVDGTERWIKKFFYVELDKTGTAGSNERNIAFNFAGSSTIYIDNFRIYESSTEIETTDLDEYSINSTFRVWDGYQNPTLSNEEVIIELWDRTTLENIDSNGEDTDNTDDIAIASYETITNTDGIVTWIYSDSLEQKEYSINCYTYRNGFGNYWYEIVGDLCDFEEGDTEDWILFGTHGSSVTEENQKLKLTGSASSEYNGIQHSFSGGDVDVSKYSHLLYQYYSTDTDLNGYFYGLRSYWYGANYVYFYQMGKNGLLDGENGLSLTETSRHYDLDVFRIYSATTNDFYWQVQDSTELRIVFDMNTFSENLYFDNIVIGSNGYLSQFHFTPNYAYSLDYCESELDDSFDFSEGDNEDMESSTTCGNGVIVDVENGIFTARKSSTVADYFLLNFFPPHFETNDYEYCYLRTRLINKDATSNWGMHITYYTPSYDNQITWMNITEDWQILGGAVLSDRTVERVRFDISETSDNNTAITWVQLDWIRMVHVESVYIYESDTYLYAGSENDKWTNAVYSDSNHIGSYEEIMYIPYNLTLGTHTIEWIPYARDGETKAYINDDIYSYEYEVSGDSNYYLEIDISIDAYGFIIYTNIATLWGNMSIRVSDNSSWLGSAVSESSAGAWTFYSTYGLHEFEICVYNGAVLWDIIYTSITIVEPDTEDLVILIWEKDLDIIAGFLYTNYLTNFGNTTHRVKLNGSYVGAETPEGATAWSLTLGYGYYEIIIEVYYDSETVFTEEFGFSIVEPSAESNYYIILDLMDIDTISGKIFINIMTAFANCTYHIADNGTSLGSAVSEGASVWDFTPTAGYHNFTITVYNGATVWDTIEYGFYINPSLFDMRITYLTTFGNKIDFDQFNTYVTTSTLNNTVELDSFVSMPQDDNITIVTYNPNGYLIHNCTYNYTEALFITLSVHYIRFSNYNNTATVYVRISWELGSTVGNITFSLGVGVLSEQYLVYRGGYYYLFYNANGYDALNQDLNGHEIVHGTIPLNLAKSDINLASGMTWQVLTSWALTIGGGFGFMWGLFNNIGKIEDDKKRRIWSAVFFCALGLVAFIGYLISRQAWQPLIMFITIIIAFIFWIRRERET